MDFSKPLRIYPTAMHACAYLPGKIARNAVIDPDYAMNMQVYDYLIKSGFRRSGSQVYRPYCQGCQACITTRILVNDFVPDRSQKRNRKRNSDIRVELNYTFKDEYIGMYARYLKARHHDSDSEGVREFLTAIWCDTTFIEFYLEDRLIGVATTDALESGLSAVYTFFKPDVGGKRGLGVFALLWEIDYARELGLDYVYPGYWIRDCSKMNYKTRFQPLEGLIDGRWQELPRDASTQE